MMPFHHERMDGGTLRRTETLYTLEEAARLWEVNENTLRACILEGAVHAVRKGEDYLISQDEMENVRRILVREDDRKKGPEDSKTLELIIIPEEREDQREEDPDGWKKMKESFDQLLHQLKRMKKPFTDGIVKERIEGFFKTVAEKKHKEVEEEAVQREVSLKLGFMTGQNEMFCDFCEVHDRFYPGAIFADVYVDGALKWVMCPNCLWYCKEQANGSLEQNVRARFSHLAHRLEREARRARNLAAFEDFRVPSRYEWEAWETASYALREVATGDEE